MKRSEYIRLETQLKAQLVRVDQRLFLIREVLEFAGVIALVLTLADATPWPLWDRGSIARLVFIFAWAVAMAWWQLSRLRRAGDAKAVDAHSA